MSKEAAPLYAKRGNRYKELDWTKVDAYIAAGCSGRQIAPKFSMHPTTLYAKCLEEKGMTFTEYSQDVHDVGIADLKLAYYDLAMDGNTNLMKELGQEYLGYGKNESSGQDEGRAIISLLKEVERLKSVLQTRGISLSELEDEQPLSHQGQGREEDPIPNELGTERTVE